MTPTAHAHIVVRDDGVPMIDETTMKVVELVTEYLVDGASPEELQQSHPYLSLGQVLSALSYYWDHKAEMDADMRRRFEYAERMRHETPVPPGVERLRRLRSAT